MKYKIVAYKASENQALNKKFINGHAKVLTDYGVTNITSYKHDWTNNPSVYCVVAFDDENDVVGGVRFHIADGYNQLPLEKALTNLDPSIHTFVENLGFNRTGELCGLWNAKKVAGMGISLLLTLSGISISNQINVSLLLGICADYTLPLFQSVGFEVDYSMGNKGEFPYPTEKYITRVIGILNAKSLGTASAENREKIIYLRNNPITEQEEKGKKSIFHVNYQLKLS
jgi:hypothetical protein